MLNVDTNLTTGKCNLGTPFKYHVILLDARAVVYPKDINYISPSKIRPCVETCFSIQFTPCIPILSPLQSLTFYQLLHPPPPPPGPKRFCDTHISSRYIINSGQIHFAGKMMQWAKIICLFIGWLLFPLFPVLIFFFIKLKGLYCTELLEGLFPSSGTGIILLL